MQIEKSQAYLQLAERQEIFKRRHMSARQKRDFVPPGDLRPEESPWLRPTYAKKPEVVVLHDPDRTIVNPSVAGIQQVLLLVVCRFAFHGLRYCSLIFAAAYPSEPQSRRSTNKRDILLRLFASTDIPKPKIRGRRITAHPTKFT